MIFLIDISNNCEFRIYFYYSKTMIRDMKFKYLILQYWNILYSALILTLTRINRFVLNYSWHQLFPSILYSVYLCGCCDNQFVSFRNWLICKSNLSKEKCVLKKKCCEYYTQNIVLTVKRLIITVNDVIIVMFLKHRYPHFSLILL